jgi:hypothetical protein
MFDNKRSPVHPPSPTVTHPVTSAPVTAGTLSQTVPQPPRHTQSHSHLVTLSHSHPVIPSHPVTQSPSHLSYSDQLNQ